MALHLGRLLGQAQPPLLGIDIGSDAVRVVELSSGRSGMQLEHFACEALPPGAVRDGGVADFETVAAALRRALKKSGSRARAAALALPSGAVITSTVSLPAGLAEDELETQVEAEASQSLPFAMDELRVDFVILGESASAADSVDILVAAARRAKIDERLALAEAAGLQAVAVDIESAATVAAVSAAQRRSGAPVPHRTALYQVRSDSSSLVVMEGERLLYEREHAVGSQKLEQECAHSTLQSQRTVQAQQARPAAFDDLAHGLARALQLFFASTPHGSVDQILLAAPAGLARELAIAAAPRVQAPLSIVDPFAGMGMPTAAGWIGPGVDASSSVVACGLALRRFAA